MIDVTKCAVCQKDVLAGVHEPTSDGFDHKFQRIRVVDSHPSGSVLTNREFWKFVGISALVVLGFVALRYFTS